MQARSNSTRLPKKVLRPLAGKPMLAQELERLKASKRIDALILATSDIPDDDVVANVAAASGVTVFRGSERDVLDRYYRAAELARADIVVRVTGDCPLHDPIVIDLVIEHFLAANVDETMTPVNLPEGLDTDVMTFSALETAAHEAKLPSEREHVMPYIRKHPERFRLDEKWTLGNGDHSAYHWSVDTEEDFQFVSAVYTHLYKEGTIFHMHDVLRLLREKPELLEIHQGGTGYEWIEKGRHEDEEWLKNHG